MLFIAIEKEIGSKKMWEWIRSVLTTTTEFTNYDYLLSTLRNTVKNEKKTQQLTELYLNNKKSVTTILTKVKAN